MSADSERIFEGINAYISTALPELYRTKLMSLISTKHGHLVNFSDSSLTHYVTDILPPSDSLDYVEPRTGLHFVTPFWVQRICTLGTRQEPAFYSPHPTMLFSGVVATSCDLSQADNEIMAAGISSLGGQWRKAITRDITHVFALSSGTIKFQTAMHFKDTANMKVVVPHWFDDTVRLGIRNLPTEPYEWPRPRVFEGQAAQTLRQLASSPVEAEENSAARRTRPPSEQKKALYDTIFNETSDLPSQRPASARIWEGRKVMFGSNLGFNSSQREAHIADVLRAGGEVVEYDNPEEELEKVEEADIYIAQHRSGSAFVKAYRLKKLIGNLHWFWYVRSTGILSRPTDQLLHYPIPKKPISGFSRHVITVTNYSGKDREYIKKMLLILGVPYTPTMSGNNTAVIAAYRIGEKVKKADDWAVPVVNHIWLEECFAQWRDIAPTLDRYTAFPPGVDFGELLAEDGGRAVLGMVAGMSGGFRIGYDQTELDKMEREIEEGVEADVAPPAVDGKTNEMRLEVMETPKRGILKKSKGATEHATATSRRLAADRERLAADRGEDGTKNASTDVYVDMSVALDDDGRLSMSGSELGFGDEQGGDENEPMGVGDSRGRLDTKRRGETQARPSTPARGRGRPPSLKMSRTSARTRTPSAPKSNAKSPVQSHRSPRQNLRTSAMPLPSEDEDENEDGNDEPSTPVRSRHAEKSKVVPAAERKDREQSNDGPVRAGRLTSRKAAMKGRMQKKGDNDNDDVFDVGSSARKGTVIKTYRAKSRSRSRSRSRLPIRDEDDYEPKNKAGPRAILGDEGSPLKKNPVRTAKTSARQKLEVPADSSTEDEQPVEAKPGSLRRASVNSEDDAIAIEELTASPMRVGTPRRRASVVLPTLKEVLSTSQQNVNASQPQVDLPEEPPALKGKEVPKNSPTKRGRPPSSRSAKQAATKSIPAARTPSPPPPPVSKPKPGRPSATAAAVQTEAGPIHAELVVAPPVKTYGRRSAATEAARRLHDEIMPDANSFAKELKSGHVRGYEDPASAKGKGREREKDGSAKGRKRPTLGDNEEEDDERDVKKRKTDAGSVSTKSKGRKSDIPLEENEVEVVDDPKRGRPAAKAKPEASTSADSRDKGVVIMTTQVTLTEDQNKALMKLGAKFTAKPLECTHLVAHKIVRTEKFLCAMAVAPHIVTEKWVAACVSKKSIQPEAPFALKDLESEKRYGYRLNDALIRARANGRKLFQGATFYMTPKIPVDSKLLKAVVTAGGGQLLTQSPTLRILKGHDNRFVVSCPADVSIWRPLAEHGHPIYSQELILTGVLKQELDWDEKTHKVPGSF
ncbi:uncharacterized protein PHACADRAFT_203428 [Phanerochaete carnosa HHB-10118-sp]|uniref:BRCT domain-containing protein n=1 Tax=Phanerochaete carnosa (strain HHB-10118-sp) TaxID=650164 RepID=K5WLU5_PHACS|nr:uncharacterized protein PHACADRAFT_203428 [Phanerochaete carnosa HHB-10118-sp]EKM60159.1 hypothetical protein PHACADRAFT_203428 [Phanerochaete carnosa HHB-10118-sp]